MENVNGRGKLSRRLQWYWSGIGQLIDDDALQLSLNFRSTDAVRSLARAMLHNDFGLDVELPSDCLVPRVPQRLNYVLFIDDLLTMNGIDTDVLGIDIGEYASLYLVV